MSLQIKYSKELAKKLGKIAVYFPGEPIEVGDIIHFPNGKTSFFSKEAPLGVFTKITSLQNLHVSHAIQNETKTKHSYKFSTENTVEQSSSIHSSVKLAPIHSNLDTDITIQFTQEGSLYFHAIDCYKKQIKDIASLEKEIISKSQTLVWNSTYLVTSVTYATKALIIQSRSKNSTITLANSLDIQTKENNLTTQIGLNIKNQNGEFFIKDWSNHVSVFMELMKFEKQTFQATTRNLKKKEKPNRLIAVDINQLLI